MCGQGQARRRECRDGDTDEEGTEEQEHADLKQAPTKSCRPLSIRRHFQSSLIILLIPRPAFDLPESRPHAKALEAYSWPPWRWRHAHLLDGAATGREMPASLPCATPGGSLVVVGVVFGSAAPNDAKGHIPLVGKPSTPNHSQPYLAVLRLVSLYRLSSYKSAYFS